MGNIPSSELERCPLSLEQTQDTPSTSFNGRPTAKEEDRQDPPFLDQTSQDQQTTSTPDGILQRPSMKDDAMPLDAQHHAAAFLSSISDPFIAADEIAAVLKNSTYINQKRKILARTHVSNSIHRPSTTRPITFTAPDAPPTLAQRLLDLPAELFATIKDLLPPADLVCLSFTSRIFYTTLDYQLVDLRNLVLASDLYDHFSRQNFTYPINRERYDVCRRLRRDKMAKLIKQELVAGTRDQLVCSACTRLHPKRYFSPSQILTLPQHRSCLATTAKIHFCTHWFETIQTIRQRNEDERCKRVTHFLGETCRDSSHYTSFGSIYSPPPTLRQYSGVQKVTKTIRIGHTDDYDLITSELISETLTKDPICNVDMCRHVKVGEQSIIGSFKRKDVITETQRNRWNRLKTPEYEVGECKECGMRWQFVVRDMWDRGLSARYELQLVVDLEIRAARDAWSREWLRFVEGGRELMELL